MKLGENAISPMWKKHENLLSNNNDAQSITKYGFLVRPHTQIVALCLSPPRVQCSDLRINGGSIMIHTAAVRLSDSSWIIHQDNIVNNCNGPDNGLVDCKGGGGWEGHMAFPGAHPMQHPATRSTHDTRFQVINICGEGPLLGFADQQPRPIPVKPVGNG